VRVRPWCQILAATHVRRAIGVRMSSRVGRLWATLYLPYTTFCMCGRPSWCTRGRDGLPCTYPVPMYPILYVCPAKPRLVGKLGESRVVFSRRFEKTHDAPKGLQGTWSLPPNPTYPVPTLYRCTLFCMCAPPNQGWSGSWVRVGWCFLVVLKKREMHQKDCRVRGLCHQTRPTLYLP
jgi:hypothetical protein